MNYSYNAKFEGNILVVGEQDVEKLPLSRTSEKIKCLGKLKR